MNNKFLITESSFHFKPGQIVLGKEDVNGVLCEGKRIYKKQYVSLTESLDRTEEERVREICREILVKMFYKLYTQSPILIK